MKLEEEKRIDLNEFLGKVRKLLGEPQTLFPIFLMAVNAFDISYLEPVLAIWL